MKVEDQIKAQDWLHANAPHHVIHYADWLASEAEEASEFTIPVTQEIPMKRILDLIATAFDGGMMNSWAMIDEAHYPDGFDVRNLEWLEDKESWTKVRKNYFAPLVGYLVFCDVEDESIKHPKFDLDSIKKGLQIMARDCPRHYTDFIQENSDAITGDVFVQCCIFGEITYN